MPLHSVRGPCPESVARNRQRAQVGPRSVEIGDTPPELHSIRRYHHTFSIAPCSNTFTPFFAAKVSHCSSINPYSTTIGRRLIFPSLHLPSYSTSTSPHRRCALFFPCPILTTLVFQKRLFTIPIIRGQQAIILKTIYVGQVAKVCKLEASRWWKVDI